MAEKKKVCREIVTIGLPLPNLLEYTADVSPETRECLQIMERYSKEHGIETHEIKARSINVGSNHSNLVSKMIGDWILIVGSDHTFAPNLLTELLDATGKPPYPKIIGAVCNYRGAPYRWTMGSADSSGERFFPLVPFFNCDPAIMSSGEIQYLDVIGSGVTLYHRSVFDKVPPPWFTYEAWRPGMPEIEEILRDWNGDFLQGAMRFDEFLEDMADKGQCSFTTADKIKLREKAIGLRRLLAKFRRPNAMGMDYHICLKAKSYGIKTYVHWGVVTHHLTLEHTDPRRYVHWLESDRANWRAEVQAREDLTFDNISNIVELERIAEINRKNWEKAVEKARAEIERQKEDSHEDGAQGEQLGSLGLVGESGAGVSVEWEGNQVHEEEGAY